MAKSFECEKCKFITDKSCNLTRHNKTKKHIDRVKVELPSTCIISDDIIEKINKGFEDENTFELNLKRDDIISVVENDGEMIIQCNIKVLDIYVTKITLYVDDNYGYNVELYEGKKNENISEFFIFI